jgi:RNase H-like domain found in reverse transcriptase
VRQAESVNLYLPEIGDQLILKTDASDFALGGVLLKTEKMKLEEVQKLSNSELISHPTTRICCFVSHLLSINEGNHNINENQLFSSIFGLLHFAPIVRSSRNPLWIFTDHRNLSFITKFEI